MNTPKQHTELNGIIQRSGNPSSILGKATAWLTSFFRSISAGFLLALALLFFASPSALADKSPPGCSGSGLGISLYTSVPDVHIGDTIYYSVEIFNRPFPACDAGATNPASAGAIRAFVVTPDGVTNNITLRRTYLFPGASDFYTNVVSYVVRAQDIRPDGTVRATATDEGDIHQNDTNSRGGGDQGVNTEVNLPCIGISALCVGTTGENGAIIFTGTVTNCGNTTLVGVTVTNFHDGGFFTVLFPTNLAIRQSATFSGSWVPLNPCLPSTATLTARASDQFTTTPRVVVSSTNITCQNTLTPGIKVTKVCPPQAVSPGQLLTFSGSVSNTGNVTLTNIVVVNNQPVSNTVVITVASLAPGSITNFTGSYLAPTNCSVADTLTATATSRCGGSVRDIASASCPILTTPQIAVTALCPTAPVLPGGTLTYSGTVRNSGNISMTNVVVVSDRPVANTIVMTVSTMAPGASTNFSATYNVPASACSVTTTFIGTGRDICTTATVTNRALATCTVITAPRIAVTLVCPVTPATAGGLITYTGMVTNTGNVILNNVSVVNNQASPSTVLTVPSLAPGAFASFFTSFTAPVDACSVSSTVKATGSDNCTRVMVTNTASATCALITTPGIKVTKVCPKQPVAPGQLLTFSGSVSNTGNVTLTNVVVVNNQPVANTVVMTVASLAPGSLTNFTGSYLAPTNCSVDDTLIASGRSICGAAVTNMVSATCPIATTPRLAVTQNCPVIPAIPGGLLTYSGTVSNAGDITVTNVVVMNNLSGATPIFTIASLAPRAIASFTGSYLAPTNCSSTSRSTATGRSVCGVAVTNTVSATCSITTTPRIVVTESCPVTPAIPGGLLTYSGTVSNAGNITLTNVVVMNNMSGAAPVFTTATLAPSAVASFTGSYLAPTNCSSTSSLTATGRSICGVAVTNTVSATCPINTTPRLVVTQNCPANPAIPGGLLTYSGTVSNAGNITVTNVVVLNNLSGATPVFTTATLTPGAVASFTGSYLAPTNCSSTSTSTATGRSICGVAATNSASATCTIMTAPQIAVTALCPTAPVLPGGTLTYSGTVRNSGNISLTNVVVVSDRPVANTIVMTVGVMAPGASTNFSATYNVPDSACSVTTTFIGTGRDVCTTATVTNRALATCTVITAPRIAVTLVCPVTPATAGGLITYTGMVTNTGNVILNNVSVVNNQASPSTVLTVPSLAPGAFASFFASFTAPVDACSVSSTVKATGSDNCTRVMVTNTASATCALITTPGIKVTKVCPRQPVSPGQLLTFSGSVSNTGNVTLTNVIVINNQPVSNTVVIRVASLAPGTITNFTGSYLAPANCSVSDTLIASGRSICGVAVTNMVSATCPIRTSPAIVVTQTCPTTPVVQGGILTYSGTVSNAGNITLTNIVVVNNWPAPNTVVFTVASLAPGAMTNFTGSYQVPANCCVAWSTVVASGQDCYGVTVTDTDSGTCTVQTMPAIVVTKVCAPGILRPGDLLTYAGVVINTGNIALMNVTVVNNQPGGGVLLLGPITLAPGESATYVASYIVPPDFCGGDTVTARGLDACSYLPAINSVTVTCPVSTAPRITVTKHCPPLPTPHGGLLVFSGTVSNLGNVTLVNVFVVNNQPSNNTPVIGPITLAPGAFLNFTGSYVVPPLCCSMTDTLTARAMDRCTGSNVSATATAICPLLYTPGIAVVQNCPPSPIPMGSLYVFGGFVTNTGDAILTNVLVFSSQAGQNQRLLGPMDLAPGQAEPYAGSLTVASNICAVTITATSQEVCAGKQIINSTPCPVATAPRLVVTQNCPPSPVSPGGLLTYSGTVSNAGNITINNVVVVNSQSGTEPPITVTSTTGGAFRLSFPSENGKSYTIQYKNTLNDLVWTELDVVIGTGGILSITDTTAALQPTRFYQVMPTPIFEIATLAPGAVASFIGSYVAPTNCSVTTTLTVTGRSLCGAAVTNAASATCPITTTTRLTVTQTCQSRPVIPGALLTYSGTVSNAGNMPLTNVVVRNNLSGATPVFTTATLAPGTGASFTGSFLAPTNCSVTSISTATGQSICGVVVTNTASATCPITTTPILAITQNCPANPAIPGVLLTYSGMVSNAGNITITNVVVMNNLSGPTAPVFTIATLAPRAFASYTGSFVTPTNCSVTSISTATGRSVCGVAVTNTARATCPITTTPILAITQNCPPRPPIPGALLTYSGTVSNAGNITLTNVVVRNNLSGASPVFATAMLAPGTGASYTGSFLAPTNCSVTSISIVTGQSICGVAVTNTASATCPILTAPQISVTAVCPTAPVLPGGTLTYNGTVRNIGNITLTNVIVVSDRPAANTIVLTVATLTPGASSSFSGTYTVPMTNACSVTTTFSGRGADCTPTMVTNTVTTTCTITTTPAITVVEDCPPGPVPAGTLVAFGGLVSNSGNIALTNVLVFSSQPSNTLVLGPITLVPGSSASFAGSYIATGGSNPTTNSTIVTNSSGTITTNIASVISTNNTVVIRTNAATPYSFGTINTISHAVVDRFVIGTNFNGLTYAGEDHGYGATEFYSMRKDTSGQSYFDTIIAGTANVADRFDATSRNFDALAYAAPDLGYGPVIFYYLSHDNAGVSTFGSITPGGVVGVVADHFVVGSFFDALTFTATDVGYGANLFYYVRHDASGLSTFGTINPAMPGTITDRFTIGTNVDAIVFTDLSAPGYGPNNFYYLRHDGSGNSTFGTIFVTTPPTGGPLIGTVTDRFPVGTNAAELAFTATDVGFGPNLFYFLRGRGLNLATNIVTTFTTNTVITYRTNTVTTYTTNSVVFFTPTNTVIATGVDICQARTVTDTADCLGSGPGALTALGAPAAAGGFFSVSFPTEKGKTYTVQYKNALNDPIWTDLETVAGTGGPLSITNTDTTPHPTRFYRIRSQ